MKERPILFSAPMILALLSGSKTQTRRALSVQPLDVIPMTGDKEGREGVGLTSRDPDPHGTVFRCKFGVPGERLWVRETHRPIFGQTCGLIAIDYKADPQEKWERMRDHAARPKWTPSIHMRREYSRILLEIVSVRVERLQSIGEADAQAEGVSPATCVHEYYDGYAKLWGEINGAESWLANPWVWVVEFKRVTP